MYLGSNRISDLANFIIGFMVANDTYKNGDPYFGDDGFINWYCETYKPELGSFWHLYFLEEAKHDEVKALELYFMRLEEYDNYRTK